MALYAVPSRKEMPPMSITEIDSKPSFERLLVATDFSAASQSAFRTALDTCVALQASLLILHVFEYAEVVPPENGGLPPELRGLYDKCRDSLDDLGRQAVRAGVTCETLLTAGIPSAAILDTISAREVDLAILGTNALHGFERLVFGSTAEAVLRQARCPVLTVGPQALPWTKPLDPDGAVVFATDFDFTTIDAIRFAAYFSHLAGSSLHCLHVLPRTHEACSQWQIVPGIVSEGLQQLADRSGVVIEPPICATTYGSEVSSAVVDYAKQQKARLIVLGVRQASLLASHVPEHITYRIITEAPCPVLTMAFASHPHGRSQPAAEPIRSFRMGVPV